MDDCFEDLTVPDDWIDIINNSQTQSDKQSQEDGASPAKRPKLNLEQSNGGNKFPLCESNDIQEGNEASSKRFCDGISIEGKDKSPNEPLVKGLLKEVAPLNSSQETLPILSSDTVQNSSSPENSMYNGGTASTKPFDRVSDVLSTSNTTMAAHSNSTSNKSDNATLDISSSVNCSRSQIQTSNSVAQDAQGLKNIFPQVHQSKIYNMLMQERSKENRLEIVSAKLLEFETIENEQNCSNSRRNICISDDDRIFEEVAMVVKELPMVDANKVYSVLESLPSTPNRVQNVIIFLRPENDDQGKSTSEQKPALVKKESTLVDDPVLKNDPVFRDMRLIAKMFPDKDRNEIYALLEANINQPNRVQVIVNEFLSSERQNPKVPDKEGEQNVVDNDVSVSNSAEVTIQEEVERLKIIFPDCDPDYIYEKLDSLKDKPERCHIIATELFEKKDYPKLKDALDKWKRVEPRKREFTVEEFLEKFPDPQKTFKNEDVQVSQAYKENAFVMLKNEFGMMKVGYLRAVLAKHKDHFLPSYQEISAGLISIPLASRRHHGRFLLRPRTHLDPAPISSNEYFIHEHWYTCNEQKVQDHLKKKDIERLIKFTEAKEKGELYECVCCFDDECLFEDLASCPEGHLFCKVCVVRSTEAAFGQMKTKFPCLTGHCDQCLPLSTLQSIVPANLFSKIVSRIQEEEVQQANIPDLVTCPYCPFATVMPNLDDKVLKCLNPECLKESCRLCHEENHIPLKCSEVESKAGRGMRIFIENYIAEAVIRKCHNCGKKFVKESGCNKMTCICHATSCYACKEKDIDYDHFNRNRRCANTDPETIHRRDMEEAAVEAKNKYLLEHPEARDAQLDTDFNKWFQNLSNKAQKKRRIDAEEDDSLSSDEDEEESDDYSESDSSEDNYY